jgi:hypothetical protein
MQMLAHGVFTWSGSERRSDRYGSFILLAEPYGASPVTVPTYDTALAQKLSGKRVRIVVTVVETRRSGHIGDRFLNIYPTTPEVGEQIELGVGIFSTQPDEGDPKITSTILAPGDGREAFWLDPRKLYRLHDQTVDVFVEETDAEFTPAPDLKASEPGLVVVDEVTRYGTN